MHKSWIHRGTLLLYSLSFIVMVNGQKALIIQPDNIEGQDTYIDSLVPDQNFSSSRDMPVMNWEGQGKKGVTKALLKFNISNLPPEAIIKSASLSLITHISIEYGGNSINKNSTETYLRRTIEPWDAKSVTWNTQPTTTRSNEVKMRSNIFVVETFNNIDVTNMLKDAFDESDSSLGIEISLVENSPDRRLVFSPSDVLSPTSRPRLTIFYYVPIDLDSCVVFQPVPGSPTSSVVNSKYTDSIFYPRPDITARADDDEDKRPVVEESYFTFDYSGLGENLIISKAYLTLFANADNPREGHSTFSGDNTSSIRRVTSDWASQTLTWNTKPEVSLDNQVILEASAKSLQDYINIDATELFIDAYEQDEHSYGYQLSLVDDSPFRALSFGSSHHPDRNRRPQMTVCYNPCAVPITVDISAIEETEYEEGISLPIEYTGSIDTYIWTPEVGLSCYDCPFPKVLEKNDVKYTLSLSNDQGCSEEVSFTVDFKVRPLLFPQIISMASGETNTFYGKGEEGTYDLTVFNRWGNVVFSGKALIANDENSGWSANNLNPGVYPYIVSQQGGRLTFAGEVTLIK